MDASYKKEKLIVLAVAAFILYGSFVPLGWHGLLEPDEGRYSEIPRKWLKRVICTRLTYVKYFENQFLLDECQFYDFMRTSS